MNEIETQRHEKKHCTCFVLVNVHYENLMMLIWSTCIPKVFCSRPRQMTNIQLMRENKLCGFH